MNLIENPWIPVRRRSGRLERIAPWQITEDHARDSIIEVAAPRPDFNGALTEFLIGLLQTTDAPQNPRQWRNRLESPPSPDELRKAFKPIAHAFNLVGDGPRFMQDLTLEKEIEKLPLSERGKRIKAIGQMLIEAPGDKTLEDNTDLFIKRGLIRNLCPACAATGLFTLQTYAPGGGQGNRTSIRGGGPLSTLVRAGTLWQTAWLNTLERGHFLSLSGNVRKSKDSDRFPWLARTRTSEGGAETTPKDVHPDQMFWAMPRRIRLLIAEEDPEATCDLCGEKGGQMIRNYMAKNLGVNYAGPWAHSLSPHFVAIDGTPRAILGRSTGKVGYRHWLGLVQSSQDNNGKRQPARVVERIVREKAGDLRLWAYGYDMDNMKARCWYDSAMPIVLVPVEHIEIYEAYVASIVKAAQSVSGLVLLSVLRALFFSAKKDESGKVTWSVPRAFSKYRKKNEDDVEEQVARDEKSALEMVRYRFWDDTEPHFFEFLHRLYEALSNENDVVPILEGWHGRLVSVSQLIFNEVSQSGAFDAIDPRRVALAWHELQRGLYGRKLREQLGLPVEARAA